MGEFVRDARGVSRSRISSHTHVIREEQASSNQSLVEMATGFFRGKLLCAAVRLRIADALAEGALSVGELAAVTKTDPSALRRLMRALASIGVVAEVEEARFALTPFGQPLRRDAPDSVWASMIFWADLLADAWAWLPDCVRAGDRTGAEAARQQQGAPSRWSKDPEAKAIFHAVFAEPAADDFASHVAAWDFSRSRVIADLGGGGGGLLAAILAAHPAARGVLVERQAAIPGAAKRFAEAPLAGRWELVAGDLLESVPPGADVYIMRCVLHGYDDESARRILRNCCQVMTPDSRLLLIEVALPNRIDRADLEIEKLMMSDVNMLAVTGGRERSEHEWAALLVSADLELRRVLPVPGGSSTMLEAARRG